MYQLHGLGLKFTGINTWKAHVYKDGALVATVPVTWSTEVTSVQGQDRPQKIVVWFRNRPLAEDWAKDGRGIVAVAQRQLNNGKERFSKFLYLASVEPIEIGERVPSIAPNATPVTAAYLQMLTGSDF